MKEEILFEKRKKRGEVDKNFIAKFADLNFPDLIKLLDDKDAQKRSVAAILIGKRNNKEAVEVLIKRLKKEKALYTKINICDSLVSCEEKTISYLIDIIGETGKNQHSELPEKGFYKSSYPLPRDIAARTLVRMGSGVLKCLSERVDDTDENKLTEMIDIIGHISFYSEDKSFENKLHNLFQKNKSNLVLQWKIICSFQGFNTNRTRSFLEEIIFNSEIKQFKWEALRCLLIQDKTISEKLRSFVLSSGDEELINVFKWFNKK
ncbi:MAG: HEAT repeat domain-containing protein [Rhodothermaceae bacterium]